MTNNNENQQENQETGQIKLCPFLNQNCVQDKCALWIEVTMMQPGLPISKKQGTCTFIALCMIASSPKPQAVPIQMPRGFNPLGRG